MLVVAKFTLIYKDGTHELRTVDMNIDSPSYEVAKKYVEQSINEGRLMKTSCTKMVQPEEVQSIEITELSTVEPTED